MARPEVKTFHHFLQEKAGSVLSEENPFASVSVKDYMSRISTFVDAVETVKGYIESSQIIPDGLEKLSQLDLYFRMRYNLRFPEAEDFKEGNLAPVMQEIIAGHPDWDPHSRLTYALIEGYSAIVSSGVGGIAKGLHDSLSGAIKEVVILNYSDSSLAKDIHLHEPDYLQKVEAATFAVVPVQKENVEDAPHTFTIDDAFDDVPKAEELPQYDDWIDIYLKLGDYPLLPGALGRLIECEFSSPLWSFANLFPLVLEYASNAQKTFATDFYDLIVDRSGSLLFHDLAEREERTTGGDDVVETIYEVINGNSPDSKAWWIFAPEVYKELLDRYTPETEAMQRVLLLARSGDGFGDRVTMDGFSFLPGGMMYKLSKNPNGKSYGFTRLKAKTIADLLLSEDKFDPKKAFL